MSNKLSLKKSASLNEAAMSVRKLLLNHSPISAAVVPNIFLSKISTNSFAENSFPKFDAKSFINPSKLTLLNKSMPNVFDASFATKFKSSPFLSH